MQYMQNSLYVKNVANCAVAIIDILLVMLGSFLVDVLFDNLPTFAIILQDKMVYSIREGNYFLSCYEHTNTFVVSIQSVTFGKSN